MKRSSLVLIFWLVTSAGWATDYHVAKTGSDSNSGLSTGAAWLTVGKCASTIVAGDTCYIGTGTYSEIVYETTSGSSGSPIVYRNETGAAPVISQPVCSGASVFPEYVFRVGGSYVSVIGLEITGGCGKGLQFDNQSNFVAQNNYVHDTRFGGIYGFNVTSSLIENNHVYNSVNTDNPGDADCIQVSIGSVTVGNHVIRGNLVHSCSDDLYDSFNYSNNTFEDNVGYTSGVNGGNGDGMKIGPGGSNTVRNNVLGSCPNICFNSNLSTGNVVENNTAYSAGTGGFYSFGGGTSTCRNNVAISAGTNTCGGGTEQTNSWNLGLTCTVASTDPSSNDYLKHAAGSPCIDVGTTLGSFSDDRIGTARPQGSAWDLGAYEYVYAAPPPSGGGPFPSNTAYLDNFARSNETPIVGPSSTGHSWAAPIQSGYHAHKLVSNTLGGTNTEIPESYLTTTFNAAQEVYATYTTSVPVGGSTYLYFMLRITNPGTASLDAIFCGINGNGTLTRGYINNDVATFLGSPPTVDAPTVGERFGCAVSGTTLTIWQYYSSAWHLAETVSIAAADAQGSGYIGVEYSASDGSYALSELRGGNSGGTAIPGSGISGM